MDIQPFDFKGHEVRIIIADDGEPRWVATDVARALGYKNPHDAISKHCRGVAIREGITDRLGRKQEVRIIAEADLYRLIVSSDLETAQEFERTVFEDVLPSIRKRGGYLTPEAAEQALTDPDFIIRLATDLKAERAKRAELEQQAEADKPKVLFADAVSTSNTAILVGDLAKILKGNGIEVGANRLFGWLRENGFLINRKGTDWNMPTQRAMELGLFKVKETAVTHSDGHVSVNKTPKVTGKGQVRQVNAYTESDRPLMERVWDKYYAS